jgi:hypothetical protein
LSELTWSSGKRPKLLLNFGRFAECRHPLADTGPRKGHFFLVTGTYDSTFKGWTARALHPMPTAALSGSLWESNRVKELQTTLLKKLKGFMTFDDNTDNSLWTEIKQYLIVAVCFSTVSVATIAIVVMLSK